MPHLEKIWLYPIKSLDGVAVEQATILPGGALAHDREFVIVDSQGRVVNGKRTEKIHRVRSHFDLTARTVTLQVQGSIEAEEFHLERDRIALEQWFSDYFGYTVTLHQNVTVGFPDDTNATGPTLVSVATLETVSSWFPDLSLDEVRFRFRTNLEIANVPAFWEDGLFSETGELVSFQLGDICLESSNPCQRCPVPTRHPFTGEKYPDFQKSFSQQRQATLPNWAIASYFNHFYKLTINTKIGSQEAGKVLKVGDDLRLHTHS